MTINSISNSIKLAAAAALLGVTLLPVAAQAQSINQQGINQRLHDQHSRIHQGVGSDQLTRGEQYRLNRRDASIHHQEYVDRRFDNGHLTRGEHRQLNRELNQSSRRIYQDKHNGSVR